MIDDDAARLRSYIEVAGRNGDARLPPEPKLGEALGISRGRLRTMLKRFENEGLIWRHVGKGTFVGPRLVTSNQNWSAAVSVDDIMNARAVLEPQLAGQAAIHATSADVNAMDQCLADMRKATSFMQWKHLDDRLHRTVAEATHNVLLLLLYDTLRGQIRLELDARMEEVFGDTGGPKSDTDGEHREFVDAIRSHHPEKAEQLMRDHLRSVRTNLFGLR